MTSLCRRAGALLLCGCLLAAGLPAGIARAETDAASAPEVSARAAAVVEASAARRLYEKNGSTRLPMASTTKVMTALLAAENGVLTDLVETPDAAVGTEGSSIYLARGERMALSDLLYGLMLSSGNDAALTIAAHIGGSVEDFCAMMNARAAEMGCTDTHFVNPNGLPHDAHYTTACDLALIAAHAMQNATVRTVASTRYHTAESGDYARTFKNKNKILWQYDGGNGVKTGFTKAAGRCLVFSAERNGMTLVGALLDAPDMWNDAAALLDYGFSLVENAPLVDAARPLGVVPVTGAVQKELAVALKCDILYPLRRDGTDEVGFALALAGSLRAPVTAGTKAGTLTLYVNGAAAGVYDVVVTEDAPMAGLADRLRQIAAEWAG